MLCVSVSEAKNPKAVSGSSAESLSGDRPPSPNKGAGPHPTGEASSA